MSYRIYYSDNGYIDVEDRFENNETDLTFTGRYRTDYGETIAQNFLYLLENFSGSSSPSNPVSGQLWFDTSGSTPLLKVYDGQEWKESSGIQRSSSESELENPSIGELWVNTGTNQVFVYAGNQWVLVGPSTANDGNSGFEVQQISASDNNEYTVLVLTIDNSPAVIISLSDFTPKTRLLGFSVIRRGVNLSTRAFSNSTLKYWGSAERAEALVIDGNTVQSRNFLRGDRVSTTDYQFNVRSNNGISVGSVTRGSMSISGSNCVFSSNASDSQFQFRFTQSSPVLSIASSGNIGINNTNPESELDVVGDAEISGILSSDTIQPSGDSSGSRIGSPVSPYGIVYSDEFVGEFNGNAQSASMLATPRGFSVTGDMTSSSISFNGTNNVVLEVEPSTGLVTNRPLQSTANDTDELLIRRGNQLARVTRRSLIRDALPIGSITMFSGLNIPDGWLECDGSQYIIDDFIELYNVLGNEYEVSATQFVVPDFTNKSPMGQPADATVGLTEGPYTGLTSELFMGVRFIIYSGVWQ